LITGPSIESIGSETAITLAQGSPSTLLLLGRDAKKIQPVIDEIKKIDGGITSTFVEVHLDSLASVRKAAQQILDDTSILKIDIIINNAGVMATPYSKSEDGIETQFAINHVSHFLLTNLLMPKLLAAQSPRVVNVSSFGNVLADIREDLGFSGGKAYNPFVAYGQSKTANVLFAVGLNERLEIKGLKAFAVDPGSWSSSTCFSTRPR
jgi:NAD(P)-dependent dehydrogenase (short-subunit alcohol dehydrogenase family)